MRDVSITFDIQDAHYAQELANEFIAQGYPIFSWPLRLEGADQYRQISSTTKIRNHSNIFLVSLPLFRSHRTVLEQLSRAIAQKRTNIHIVSMDDQWYKVKGNSAIETIVKSISSISYFQEPRVKNAFRPAAEIADAIIKMQVVSDSEGRSFFSTRSLQQLLESTYNDIRVVDRANEQSGRIHYTILDGVNRVTGREERYIAIFPDATIEATKDFIDYKSPQLFNHDALYVVRSQPQSELSLLQKERLRSQFKATPLRFETMVGARQLRVSQAGRLFGNDEFVIPQRWDFSTRKDTVSRTTAEMVEYFENDLELEAQRRISIINGAGGSGKTHFVRHLHDIVSSMGQEVFFLTANSVSNLRYVTTIESIYDIYACCCSSEEASSALTKDLFELKFLVDGPIIIVDGLEEITTMLGDRFIRDRFLFDCIDKSKQDSNGRIIITTREGRWPGDLADYCRFLTIHPFSLSEADDYFKHQFLDDPERLPVARRLFASMASLSDGIPPLFCDMISEEVKSSPIVDINNFLDQSGTARTSSLHAFVENILQRELGKTDIGLDSSQVLSYLSKLAQISVFGGLSLAVALDVLKDMWGASNEASRRSFVENLVFLKCDFSRDILSFRYEFLTTLFLAQYVRERIEATDTEVFGDQATRMIFTNNLLPGADVDARIILDGRGGDVADLLTSIELLINFVSSESIPGASEHERRLLCSNLLYLRLSLDKSISDATEVRRIILTLFGGPDPGNIRGFSVMHFGQGREHRFRFDLRGLKVEDSWFIGIDAGSTLIADSHTKFRRCRFSDCDAMSIRRKSGLYEACYEESCDLDVEFASALAALTSKAEISKEKKKTDLKRFLASFNAGYDFSRPRKRNPLVGEFVSRTGTRTTELIDLLMKQDFLELVPDQEEIAYRLREPVRSTVRRFVMDGIISKVIRDLVDKM